MCIAFKIENIRLRDKMIEIFYSNNIQAYTWPNLPEEILIKKGNGYKLQQKILCVPITFENSIKYI